MITIDNVTKTFDGFRALDGFTSTIVPGSIYGLVGSNGSGKSTLLRLIAGIYRADGGSLSINGINPYENPEVKKDILFVADEPYFFPSATMNEMARYYSDIYPSFDKETYQFLCDNFPIDPKKNIATFSKGMKRQVSIILALSSKPKFLLLDEAFDGLDPVVRAVLRKLLADAVAERELTVLIASHNLRELEDLCDQMGLLHKGKVLFQKEIDEAKLGLCKIQVAFQDAPPESFLEGLNILSSQQQGSVLNLVARGNVDEIKKYAESFSPLLLDSVPLTLEEVFIYEMEAVGYDYNRILF